MDLTNEEWAARIKAAQRLAHSLEYNVTDFAGFMGCTPANLRAWKKGQGFRQERVARLLYVEQELAAGRRPKSDTDVRIERIERQIEELRAVMESATGRPIRLTGT